MSNYVTGLLLFTLLATGAFAQDTWKEYSYQDQGMAFSMPTAPADSTQSIDTAAGKVDLHEHLLDQGATALIVGMNVYPDSVLKTDPNIRLAGGRDGALKAMHANLVSQKNITIDGNPGLEFHFKGDSFFGVQRIYIVGKLMYQLASTASVNSPLFPDTDRFFSSFRLIKP